MVLSKNISQASRQIQESLKTYYPDNEAHNLTRMIFAEVLKNSQKKISPEAEFSDSEYENLQKMATRLVQLEPIQYIIGEAHFYGRDFLVEPGVLIPRGETEELVVWIRNSLRPGKEYQILDIGTGSGCIPISLEKELEQRKISTRITSIDLSEAALKIAQKNVARHESRVKLIHQDIFTTNEGSFSELDIVVSNPPYVMEKEKAEMHENVLKHEPELALFVSDHDPLIFYRFIAQRAQNWLKDGGWLYFEINEALGSEMIDLMENTGFSAVELKKDLHSKDRMIRGQK
jgi:release factor glutamine methyltransferase